LEHCQKIKRVKNALRKNNSPREKQSNSVNELGLIEIGSRSLDPVNLEKIFVRIYKNQKKNFDCGKTKAHETRLAKYEQITGSRIVGLPNQKQFPLLNRS
jgi:hypothetical protein